MILESGDVMYNVPKCYHQASAFVHGRLLAAGTEVILDSGEWVYLALICHGYLALGTPGEPNRREGWS